MTFHLCFNFKLSECVGLFGSYIRGVADRNEWKTEKRHECTMSRDFQFGTLKISGRLIFFEQRVPSYMASHTHR